MNYNYEELRKSLETIKNECKKYKCCSSCPLSISTYRCGITLVEPNLGVGPHTRNKPSNWNIPPIRLLEAPTEYDISEINRTAKVD